MCDHVNFFAKVNVVRMHADEDKSKIVGHFADITINCSECGVPMQFIGVNVGISFIGPATNLEATELRIPLRVSNAPMEKDPNKIYN